MSRTKNRYLGNKNKSGYTKIYKCGIYARVSVDNKDNSINNQIELAKEYIIKNTDVELVQVYIDNGISGKDFCRKGYKKLMSDIEKGLINCIIVKDISRLGRNFIEISKILEYEMVINNIRVISINDNYDSICHNDCREDGFVYNNTLKKIILHNMINEIYIRDTSYKIKKSKEYQKQKGAYMGVYAPYGYRIEKINGVRKLVVEDCTHVIIDKMCSMYREKQSYTYIQKYLYSLRINTKTDYRKSKAVYAKEKDILKKWSIKSIKETIEGENNYI